jgi:quercetin dioxygenase-like cupin family protein
MKPNHIDERGAITDLMVTPEYSITHITFSKGAVRGNHYHKRTKQIDFIIKGRLICASGKEKEVLVTGDTVCHKPKTPHAYKAVLPSEMISVCWGERRGHFYESDTFRLDEDKKLI